MPGFQNHEPTVQDALKGLETKFRSIFFIYKIQYKSNIVKYWQS